MSFLPALYLQFPYCRLDYFWMFSCILLGQLSHKSPFLPIDSYILFVYFCSVLWKKKPKKLVAGYSVDSGWILQNPCRPSGFVLLQGAFVWVQGRQMQVLSAFTSWVEQATTLEVGPVFKLQLQLMHFPSWRLHIIEATFSFLGNSSAVCDCK